MSREAELREAEKEVQKEYEWWEMNTPTEYFGNLIWNKAELSERKRILDIIDGFWKVSRVDYSYQSRERLKEKIQEKK